MKNCHHVGPDSSAPSTWHRLTCPECSASQEADARLAREWSRRQEEYARLQSEAVPEGLLTRTLERLDAAGLLPPVNPHSTPARRAHAYRWLAYGGAVAGLAAAVGVFMPSQRPASVATVRPEAPGSISTPPGPGPNHPQDERPVAHAGIGNTRLVGNRSATGVSRGPAARRRPTGEAAATLESRFLDGRDPALLSHWMVGADRDTQVQAWLRQKLPPMRDDFVRVPSPLLASGKADGPAVKEAIRQYEKEARAVDVRLVEKVTLHQKAVSLEELCQALQKQTRVVFRASNGVRDEKVTVLVKDQPLRNVMREVARLFGYFWSRVGEEGAYTYTLEQDLRSQLAEEEMRNRDQHAALLDVDAQMGEYRPYLELGFAQLQERLTRATGAEKTRLQNLIEKGGWGAMQYYHRLTPAQRAALLEGQNLRLASGGTTGEQALPAEWVTPILQSIGARFTLHPNGVTTGRGETRVTEVPGAAPSLGIHLDRSELGYVTLEGSWGTSLLTQNGGKVGIMGGAALAVGRSPSSAKPDNATANRALAASPEFRKEVSWSVRPGCREPVEAHGFEATKSPHVTSADVWEAVHQATGLPIVADSYTHLYPPTSFTVNRVTLLDALSRTGDALGVRWKRDEGFILARSTGYFWDKLKEVPNRFLRRWQTDDDARGYVPLDDVLEMATASDAQLDSELVAAGVSHCWRLEGWNIPARTSREYRQFLRFMATLDAEARGRALTPEGLRFREMAPSRQREFWRLLEGTPLATAVAQAPELLGGARLRASFLPAGWYTWPARNLAHARPTPEEALAAWRAEQPAATAERIERCGADLYLAITLENGAEVGWSRRMQWDEDARPRRAGGAP